MFTLSDCSLNLNGDFGHKLIEQLANHSSNIIVRCFLASSSALLLLLLLTWLLASYSPAALVLVRVLDLCLVLEVVLNGVNIPCGIIELLILRLHQIMNVRHVLVEGVLKAELTINDIVVLCPGDTC